MNNAVILDFMGVVANLDYVQLALDLPLNEKFKAFRVALKLLKTPELKKALQDYQAGKITQNNLINVFSKYCQNASIIVPKLLKKIAQYVFINYDVLKYAEIIRSKGVKVYILSNTIPETEHIIKTIDLNRYFDDVVFSTEVKMTKPNPNIYNYMISKYNLSPRQTLFLDDSKKNLIGAERLGISSIQSSNPEETCDILDCYLSYLEMPKTTFSEKTNLL